MPLDARAVSDQANVVTGGALQLSTIFSERPPTATAVLTVEEETRVREAVRALHASLADLETMVGEREAASEFSDFFSAVGNALVRAQRALDTQTQSYLVDVSQRPHLLPAVFRIPALTADIKFALEKATKEELRLIFHSGSREAREQNQQSVHFEVVAAPPPPGILQDPAAGAWRPALVLSFAERTRILSALQIAAGSAKFPNAEKDALQQKVLPDPDGILIFRGDSDDDFFLLAAHGNDVNDIGAWYLATGAQPALSVAYAYNRSPGTKLETAGMTPLQQYVSDACTQQRTFLSGLRAVTDGGSATSG